MSEVIFISSESLEELKSWSAVIVGFTMNVKCFKEGWHVKNKNPYSLSHFWEYSQMK